MRRRIAMCTTPAGRVELWDQGGDEWTVREFRRGPRGGLLAPEDFTVESNASAVAWFQAETRRLVALIVDAESSSAAGRTAAEKM